MLECDCTLHFYQCIELKAQNMMEGTVPVLPDRLSRCAIVLNTILRSYHMWGGPGGRGETPGER